MLISGQHVKITLLNGNFWCNVNHLVILTVYQLIDISILVQSFQQIASFQELIAARYGLHFLNHKLYDNSRH